jgi:hypothetical protein
MTMFRRSVSSTYLCLTAFGAAGLLAVSTAAPAGDAAKEISVAAEHAGYGATATAIATTQAHLHHTINCLVGPGGKGFDAAQLNPCQDLGNGAIPETTDAAKKQMLEDAVAKAEAGLATPDFAAAKAAAAEAAALLKKAM